MSTSLQLAWVPGAYIMQIILQRHQSPFSLETLCVLTLSVAGSTPSTACQNLTQNVGFVYVSINISQFKTGAVPSTNRMEYP